VRLLLSIQNSNKNNFGKKQKNVMRIVFLGSQSIHTTKWANAMHRQGHEVYLITMHPDLSQLNEGVNRYILYFKGGAGYFLNFFFLKKLLKRIHPDLLHTHYASGYGTLARLSGYHPNLLSVWGSDVYLVPEQSALKRAIVQKNLNATDYLAATCSTLKGQTQKVMMSNKEIAVTYFGVDCSLFAPQQQRLKNKEKIRIGTVKGLNPVYGISTLIRACSIVINNGRVDIELILVGEGPQEEELKQLVTELKIQNYVQFMGPIPHEEVPKMLNTFDIYVALSNNEGFGVAVLEASACEVPVITSDVGGLPEVVRDGESGFLVPPNNAQQAADKIEILINNVEMRHRMGKEGRKFVLQKFEWENCVKKMETVYENIVQGARDKKN
jgi:L-malate glycosyltransferase